MDYMSGYKKSIGKPKEFGRYTDMALEKSEIHPQMGYRKLNRWKHR